MTPYPASTVCWTPAAPPQSMLIFPARVVSPHATTSQAMEGALHSSIVQHSRTVQHLCTVGRQIAERIAVPKVAHLAQRAVIEILRLFEPT